MYVLMRGAVNNCLRVDDRLRRAGVVMVLKCNCCTQGDYEDLNHVLCTGEIASTVWRLCS